MALYNFVLLVLRDWNCKILSVEIGKTEIQKIAPMTSKKSLELVSVPCCLFISKWIEIWIVQVADIMPYVFIFLWATKSPRDSQGKTRQIWKTFFWDRG